MAVESGGERLRERVKFMWDNWTDDNLALIVSKGIVDPHMLVLASRDKVPDGAQAGPHCEKAYHNANHLLENLQDLIGPLKIDRNTKKQLLKIVRSYGEERECAGHIGAWLELLAADQLYNSYKNAKTNKTKRRTGKRGIRLFALKRFILENSHHDKTAYALRHGYVDDIRAFIVAAGSVPTKDDDTLEDDLREVLLDIKFSTS